MQSYRTIQRKAGSIFEQENMTALREGKVKAVIFSCSKILPAFRWSVIALQPTCTQ
jgi:hypothetical protein